MVEDLYHQPYDYDSGNTGGGGGGIGSGGGGDETFLSGAGQHSSLIKNDCRHEGEPIHLLALDFLQVSGLPLHSFSARVLRSHELALDLPKFCYLLPTLRTMVSTDSGVSRRIGEACQNRQKTRRSALIST